MKNFIKKILKIYLFALIFGVIISVMLYFVATKRINNSEPFEFLIEHIKSDTAFTKIGKIISVNDEGNSCINLSKEKPKAIFNVTIKYLNNDERFLRFFMIKDSVEWKVINYEINPKYSIYKGCD